MWRPRLFGLPIASKGTILLLTLIILNHSTQTVSNPTPESGLNGTDSGKQTIPQEQELLDTNDVDVTDDVEGRPRHKFEHIAPVHAAPLEQQSDDPPPGGATISCNSP